VKKPFYKYRYLWVAVASLVLGAVVLARLSGLLVNWLWMREVGYVGVFWKILSVKALLFLMAFAFVFAYLWFNLRILMKRITALYGLTERHTIMFYSSRGVQVKLPLHWLRYVPLAVTAPLGLFFGRAFLGEWDTFLRFFYGGSFGLEDPLFSTDVGFYVFKLPFLELVQNGLAGLVLFTFVVVLIAYLYTGHFRGPEASFRLNWPVMHHLAGLLVFFIILWGWGYWLDRYDLLYSTRGITYGAGYTDHNIVAIALWVMLFASLALGAVVLAAVHMRKFRVLYLSAAVYAGLILVLMVLLPDLVQKFKVEPNELELEERYLGYNIEATRRAYLLDTIETRDYPGLSDLTLADLERHRDTLENVRIWDWRPIRQTYRQTQEMRAYYKFYEVDVDRYHLEEGGYRQVMLSARELEESLPAQARTWVNQHLQFTHGFGVAMSPVAEKTEEGLPQYLIKDLPPRGAPGLDVELPAVYYGEKTPGYRIVNTAVEEFDYPRGDENVYTRYQGTGGIPVSGLLKRMLFAWELSDINILLTSYITDQSRIQFRRRIQERISTIAPFVMLDPDPYLVLSEGRLFWMQDGYTASRHYPYSEPYRSLNYIRNSVKVVVDAYHGTVNLYVADPKDPVVDLYRRAFPGVFKALSQMPPDLKAHVRYPETLFSIQAHMYSTYHMTIPRVFYNKEDLWTLPREKYAGSPIQLEPYYILIRLPGEETLQYLIMTPFTPENRDNMIAWLAGRSDFPDYGKLIVYKLPKERLIFGPIQVEAMIDQDAVISQQLSLWDQRGSRVIRGNLIVIPLEHSFLYIEPVYLIAEETDIPQLKRIIAVHGKRVVMEPTLEGAVRAALSGEPRPPAPSILETLDERATPRGALEEVPAALPAAPEQLEPATTAPAELDEAREHFQKAEDALQRGDWESFGREMEKVKRFLEKPQK
jgi:uncharacterized membrane protein (UPF0182 family)